MARILLVLRPDTGGAFRHVRDLSQGLTAAGHDVAVCGPLAHRADQLAAEVIPVEIPRPIELRGDLRRLRELAAAVRRWKPDVIHAHGTKASVYARAGRPAYPRTPVVYTPHLYPFASHLAGDDARTRRRYRAIERLLSPLATLVICVCEFERRIASSIGPARRTRVVYNGTDPNPGTDAAPEVRALRGDGPVVVAVGELRPQKGMLTLVQSWPAVAERHPGAVLAIVGDGERRAELESEVARLGLERSVRLLGRLPGDAALAGADLFVNPAWAESFSYVILEAMAHGLPIVATDVGGTGEAIEDGVTGGLVPARDPQALGERIVSMLEDRTRAAGLGMAAKERHGERFTLGRMVEGTLGAYSEVADGLPDRL